MWITLNLNWKLPSVKLHQIFYDVNIDIQDSVLSDAYVASMHVGNSQWT